MVRPLMRLAIILLAVTTPLLAACSSGDAIRARIEPTVSAPPATDTTAPTDVPTPKTVVLDPGHGGAEVGAAANGVVEKDANLDMALRVQRLLEARGVRVVLTRTADTRADGYTPDPSLSGRAATRQDLQARVDLANEHNADLFVSIHSNGSSDTAESGVEVWFDPNRPFGGNNKRLAATLLGSVLHELHGYGYAARDRGIKDDNCFRIRDGRCRPLYVLGPARNDAASFPPTAPGRAPFTPYARRASAMPGALVELLFISNAADAAILRNEAARDAIARGVADGMLEFMADR